MKFAVSPGCERPAHLGLESQLRATTVLRVFFILPVLGEALWEACLATYAGVVVAATVVPVSSKKTTATRSPYGLAH